MPASGSKSLDTIGFLTIREHPEQGFLGGYLIPNAARRPLEFHCTAPLRPNRAQEILYGPTLRPFLYGEQIGLTLLEKTRSKPIMVCTDVEPALTVREHSSVPVLWVERPNREGARSAGSDWRVDTTHQKVPAPAGIGLRVELGPNRVALPLGYESDRDELLQQWQRIAEDFDLGEPFDRIHEAIEEAQRAAAAASSKS